ncbi:MAG: insulinase family protein [bacterium]|nr:insulinase family protein [bacterium]
MTSMTSLANTQQSSETVSSRVHQFKLGNGLDVLVIPDHRAPVVTHMVWYRVGAADEPRGTSGIAHFLEHLMFKGTDKITSGEFSKIIARNGGQDNAFTSQDATVYHQRVAKDRLPIVMEMEADRMHNLKLAKKEVLTERDVILEERRSRVDNDPSSILSEQMMATLYSSHPYGTPVIGWEHEMAKLSREDALSFYKRFYAPNNAILIVAGDVTPEQVKKLATKIYGPLKREDSVGLRARVKEPAPAAPRRVTLKDPRTGKATFNRLYHAPSYSTAEPGEAEALDLMMKILAGGSTSRLYNRLVVDDKIATSIGGWFSGNGRDYGRIGLYAIAAGKKTLADVETALDKILREFIEKGATKKELERSKNAYIAEYVYGVDSQSTLARRYGWALVVGQSVKDVEEWPKRLEKVTLEDISRVAKKYLLEKSSVTGLLLPGEKKPKTLTKANKKQGKRG